MAKKLYKSSEDCYIDGVCGGIAEYLGLDSTLVRIGLIAFCFMGGSGILAYIIAMIIMPERPGGKKKKKCKDYDEHYNDYGDDEDDYQAQNRNNDDYGNGPRPSN